MEKLNSVIMPFAFIFIIFLVFTSQVNVKETYESSIQSSVIEGDETYCTAIRGNGELIPAHWAALANIIEEKQQIPVGGAGGSSASITLFVLDSLFKSPLVYKDKTAVNFGLDKNGLKKLQQSIDYNKFAFLLKMIPEHLNYAMEWKKGGYSQLFVLKAYLAEKAEEDEPGDDAALNKENPTERDRIRLIKLVKQILKAKEDAGFMMDAYYLNYRDKLLEIVKIKSLKDLINFKRNAGQKLKEIKYLISNFKEAMKYFSSFNAEKDKNLFFRPGLIDFKQLGRVINDLLSFYVHADLKKPKGSFWSQKMHEFVDKCHVLALNKPWMDKKHTDYPVCKRFFEKLLADYYDKTMWRNSENNMYNSKVGSQFAAIPTTSVISSDEGIGITSLVQDAYNTNSDDKDQLINDYVLDFNRDIFLGYWYNQEYKTLQSNVRNNHKSDLKSQKFLNLGNTSWSTVLATSPAEPGLTNVREFTSSKLGNLISAGGWSDLHPVIVLKELEDAGGNNICDKVFYITRKNGESNFNQKVVLRLIGMKDELKINSHDSCKFKTNSLIDKYDEVTSKGSDLVFHWTALLNNNDSNCISVSDKALGSIWGRMSYWWNPKYVSSIKRSADMADDVYCTNWDSYKVFKGELPLVVEDAYSKAIWREASKKETPSRVGCW